MTSVNELLTDDAKLLAWLSSNGVPITTTFGIDLRGGRTGSVEFRCEHVDLAKVRAGLTGLTASYQEHIDADHAALKKVWEMHGNRPGHDYCPEDGFPEPCRTKRAIMKDAPDET